ncbi:hypothetical protein EV426DRAFT_580310 [Tirmania nivea]|nr:hypothetical protein EV426DRAFT_580310 [Tirmania nivea]
MMAPPPPIRRSGRLQPPSRRLELDSDLFSLSTHPTERLLAVGESSGRVGVWGWPEEEDGGNSDEKEEEKKNEASDDDTDSEDTGGKPKVLMEKEVISDEQWWQRKWSAKRHKGSTRCVRFSGDGEVLFSTGTDSLLKAASASTGKVISKSWLPGTIGNSSKPSNLGAPATALLPLNPQHILVGTDAAKIHLLDLRTSITSLTQIAQNTLPTAVVSTWTPDAPIDYISALTALPPGTQSATGYSYHFLATGGGYLFHLDSRRPGKILHISEDQDDELLCSLVVEEWPGAKPRPEVEESGKILTGFGSGVLGIWNRGAYEGHYERINVSKAAPAIAKKSKRQKTSSTAAAFGGGESVDCITLLPSDFSPLINNLDKIQRKRQAGFFGRHVAVGTGDGRVKVVRTGGNPGVVGVYEHFPMSDRERERGERRKRLEAAGVKVDENELAEEEEPREAVLALEVTSEGKMISGGGSFVTMFFEVGEVEDGEEGEARMMMGDSDSDEDNEKDSDGDGDGWGSDSSEDRKKEKKEKEKRKKRKKNKGNGRLAQKPNVIGSFVGLN